MMRLLLTAFILIGSALGASASSQGTTAAEVLAGKWKSTVVPAKGEAPMIAPEITVEAKGGAVTVAMAKESPIAATVFDGGKGAGTFLMLKRSMGPGMATVVIRSADAGRIRAEYFVEYPAGSRNKNFYYSELFAREK